MKKLQCVYSQFISVDVSKGKDSPEQYVKACKIEDFFKWCLENKNLKVTFKDLWLCLPEIYSLLEEMLSMKIMGWRVDNFFIEEGWSFVETQDEVKFFNQKGESVPEAKF